MRSRISFDEFLSRFPDAKRIKTAKGCKRTYQAKCPCHNDKEASLTISETNDGKILLHCHAGCNTEDILEAVGFTFKDLSIEENSLTCLDKYCWFLSNKYEWEDSFGVKHTGYGEGVHVAAEYRYCGETYLYSKIRFEGGLIQGKEIKYAFIDHLNDKAEWGKPKDIQNVLYRLNEFRETRKHSQYAFYVEGEKDVETLRKLKEGFGCVTTAGGASDWRPEFSKEFKGLNVIIFRDNDQAGIQSTERIVSDLRNYAYSVKVVNPSRIDHGDVTDYLTKEGGTAQSLKSLCEASSEIYYARWVTLDKNGTDKGINSGILAETISRNEHYVIKRNPKDDKDTFLFYENGVYSDLNKSGIKAMIRDYIPTAKVTDAGLVNVSALLFATNEGLCSEEDLNPSRFINLQNGLYDLKEKKLIPHTPEIISTIQLPFKFEQGSRHMKNFEKYITDLCTKPDGSIDKKEIDILQEYLGFLLSNEPMLKIKTALVLYSKLGNSGKSVFIRLISKILGVNRIASIKLQELRSENRFILGNLPDCRLIACGDESNTTITDSSIFKSLTGGDPIKVEPKGKQGYSFIFNGGIVIACNGLPHFSDDKGNHLFERLLILPCEHHITENERDSRLDEKLEAELPSIFIWALEGLERLIKNNFIFTKSESSTLTKEKYHQTMDNVYRFISENYIITGNYSDRVSKTELDEAYHRWASSDSSIEEIKKKNLPSRLEAIGITTDKGNIGDSHHISVYRGLKVKETDFTPVELDETDELPFD